MGRDDAHLQWESLKRPTSDSDPFYIAELLGRRPAQGLGWEYLLQLAAPERVRLGSFYVVGNCFMWLVNVLVLICWYLVA